MNKRRKCSRLACEHSHHARGLCNTHYNRRRREAAPEQKREYDRRRYKANQEQFRKYSHQYYVTNRKQNLESQRRWRAARPDYQREWSKEHPEARAAIMHNYQHSKRANGGTFPRAAWEHLKALFGHCCAYCGRLTKKLTQDHVVPISKGGWHFSGNIVPACQSCNSQKGNRKGPPCEP